MKRYLLLLLVFSTNLFANAQVLLPFQENGLWGYRNENAEWVIEPQFDYAHLFSEGVASVRMGGNYFFIDSSGTLVSPFYEAATSFRLGRALVYLESGWWIVDAEFHVLSKESYEYIYLLGENFFEARKAGRVDVLRRDGSLLVTCEEVSPLFIGAYKIRQSIANGDSTFLLLSDETFLPFHHSDLWERSTPSTLYHQEGNSLTFLDNQLDTLFTISSDEFSKLNSLSVAHGYQFPIIVGGNLKDSLWHHPFDQIGIISESGEFLQIPPEYKVLHPFIGGRAFARKENGKYVMVDESLRQLSSDEYDHISGPMGYDWNSVRPLNSLVRIDKTWRVIDSVGNAVHVFLDTTFANAESYYSNGLNIGVFYMNRKPYLYHFDSKQLYGPFDKMRQPMELEDGWVFSSSEEKVYVLETGEIVIGSSTDIDYVLNSIQRFSFNPKEIALEDAQGLSEACVYPSGLHLTIDTELVQWSSDSMLFGYTLILSNCDGDTVWYDKEEGYFPFIIEALDPRDGQWKEISFRHYGGCLRSGVRQNKLLPDEKHFFMIPRLDGGIETLLRVRFDGVYKESFRLERPKPTEPMPDITTSTSEELMEYWRSQPIIGPRYELIDVSESREVYSNEIPVRINPQQFWNVSNLEEY